MKAKDKKIRVEVSARHCHLSQKDLDKIFGKGYKLRFYQKLTQHSDFASKEIVTIAHGKNRFEDVRVVGPTREKRIVEIAKTDAYHLGLNPRVSIYGTDKDKKVWVIGRKGKVKVPVIIKQRHVHMSEKEAKNLGLKKKDMIKIRVGNKRAAVFENFIVRTDPQYRLAAHLDTDEGNAAGIEDGAYGRIVG